MAKTINSGANVVTTQTFTAWLDVTNEMARAFANVISVDLETFPTGTAGVNGAFVANTLTVTTGLLTANASANVSGNLSVSDTISVGSNVVSNTSTITVGNTSIFSSIKNSGFEVGNTKVNADRVYVGNSTVNTVITQSGIDTDGTLDVLGETVIANTLSAGNTTITGFANVSSTLQVAGATAIGNTLSTGNTSITGFANVSGTANVGGATTLRSTLTVNGAVTIANTLSTGNTTITGFANVSGTANVGGAATLRGTLTVNGAVTIANTLSVGNTTISGTANITSSATIGANVVANTSAFAIGNSTVNTVVTSSSISTTGNLTVLGSINRNPVITLGGVLSGNVTLTDLQSGTLAAAYVADSVELGTHTSGNYVATITTANGISGAVASEGSTAALKVVPGNGITANSTGVHVVVSNGLSVNASSVSVVGNNGIVSNTSGVFVRAGTDIVVNANGVNVGSGVARLASPTFTGTVTTANLTISGMITANSAAGVDGTVLRSDGTKVYWGLPLEAGDTGFIVDVSAGDGLVKTGTASEPTIGVRANNGITANTTGLFVKTGTGLFTNTTGLFVNASSISVGTLPVGRGGTGATTFTSGALLKGNTTGAIQVASAADIVGQIGSTQVANAVFANTAGATTGTLIRGAFLTGNNFNGSSNTTFAVDATSASTASKVVARDANSSFSANVVNVNVLNTTSDIRLKSNLVIIDDPIEKVKALTGYTYNRVGSMSREAGVVADEVQSVLPEVVSLENGYLTVAYGNMIALLIEAIKDQQKQIDELKTKLGE